MSSEHVLIKFRNFFTSQIETHFLLSETEAFMSWVNNTAAVSRHSFRAQKDLNVFAITKSLALFSLWLNFQIVLSLFLHVSINCGYRPNGAGPSGNGGDSVAVFTQFMAPVRHKEEIRAELFNSLTNHHLLQTV